MQNVVAFLESFLEWTAWEMTKPRAYGPFHIVFTLVGLSVSLFAAYKLRHTGERGNRIVLLCSGLFLILTEVYKQLFYFYCIEDHAYRWGIFPFQLCSVPMYLCVIAALIKPCKLRDGMYGFMTTFNLLGGIMAFIEPSGIVHEYWTLTVHAFVWHMMLIFIGAYLIASGRFAKTWRDYRAAVFTFLALAALAFCINCIFRGVSDGGINMFFVGPGNSSLIVFKQISEAAGWYVSTLLYLPTVCLGALVVFLPAHFYAAKKGMLT